MSVKFDVKIIRGGNQPQHTYKNISNIEVKEGWVSVNREDEGEEYLVNKDVIDTMIVSVVVPAKE